MIPFKSLKKLKKKKKKTKINDNLEGKIHQL